MQEEIEGTWRKEELSTTLPDERDQAIAHAMLVFGISAKVSGEKSFFIEKSPNNQQ